MPVFAIRPIPTQIAQSITQAALIQNLGETNVYLDTESSVSIASYGIVLAPRSSITWQADSTLWAATATGNESTLSVMYGADSATLGEVSVIGTVDIEGDVHLDGPVTVEGDVTVSNTVAIDGTVSVDLPVKVQGGGSELHNQVHVVPPNQGQVVIDIDGPPDGLTYYGLRIALVLDSADIAAGTEGRITAIGYGDPNFVEWQTVLSLPIEPTSFFGQLGLPNVHAFTIPLTVDYPYRIVLTNLQTANRTVHVGVWGVSHAPTQPTTEFSVNMTGGSVAFEGTAFVGADNSRIMLPPSFQSYKVRTYLGINSQMSSYFLYSVVGASGNQRLAAGLPSWDTLSGDGILRAGQSVIIEVPGTGSSMYLQSTGSANEGNVFLTLIN